MGIHIYTVLLYAGANNMEIQCGAEASGSTIDSSEKSCSPPLTDKRENNNSNVFDGFLLSFFPGGLYFVRENSIPERTPYHSISARLWTFSPKEDISKAIADEFNNSGLFTEAFFTYKASDGELVLRGDLISTDYKATIYSYGYMPLLGLTAYILGLPTYSFRNDLVISLRLEDPATKRILWKNTYKKTTGTKFVGLYWGPDTDLQYNILLKEIMEETMRSLKKEAPQFYFLK